MGLKKTFVILLVLLSLTAAFIAKKSIQQDTLISNAQQDLPPIDFSGYQTISHDMDTMKGQAFSPVIENKSLKTKSWQKKPVTYDQNVGEADLAITLDQQLYDQFLGDIKLFAEQRNIKIAMNKGTCGISAKQLSNKTADMGGFCCPPGSSDRLPGLRFHTLGIASIALLVHPENPVDDVSTENARKIFRGHIRYWKELPGSNDNNRGISIVTRLHCKARPGHWTLINSEGRYFSPYIRDVPDIPFMIQQVSNSRLAIGYETLFMVNREKKPVKLLKLDGLHPSNLQALSRGFYPFYRVYNLTTWAGPAARPLATELVEYLLKQAELRSAQLMLVPASQLRANGWGFSENELISEPGPNAPSI